jgi:hypothetical protein
MMMFAVPLKIPDKRGKRQNNFPGNRYIPKPTTGSSMMKRPELPIVFMKPVKSILFYNTVKITAKKRYELMMILELRLPL